MWEVRVSVSGAREGKTTRERGGYGIEEEERGGTGGCRGGILNRGTEGFNPLLRLSFS